MRRETWIWKEKYYARCIEGSIFQWLYFSSSFVWLFFAKSQWHVTVAALLAKLWRISPVRQRHGGYCIQLLSLNWNGVHCCYEIHYVKNILSHCSEMLAAMRNSITVQVLPNSMAMFGNLTFRFKSLIWGSQVEDRERERKMENLVRKIASENKLETHWTQHQLGRFEATKANK